MIMTTRSRKYFAKKKNIFNKELTRQVREWVNGIHTYIGKQISNDLQ